MSRNRTMLFVGLLVAISMLLASCGPTPTATPVANEPAVTAAPVVTDEPVASTTRHGGWADQLVFTSNPDMEAAIAQVQAGEIDVYAMSMSDPDLYKVVREDANLKYTQSVGVYDAFMFNPVQTFTDGRINPFGYPEVREAVNWIIDRNFMIQEYMGGLGLAKVTPLTGSFPDYARYIDVVRAMESKYAYNPEKGNQVITAKMEELGFTKNADGKWMQGDQPVVIIAIIRTEDERNWFGDYLCAQLENIGFTCDRQYKSRREASPIWYSSDPYEGLWNFYTAGWINNFVQRDEGSNFALYYSPLAGSSPNYQARTPSDELAEVTLALLNNDFGSNAERDELFRKAIPLGMEDGCVLSIVDTMSYQVTAKDIQTSYDLAANIAASYQWPYAMRWIGQEGGTIRIAQGDLMVEPWNPIGGSNWVDDGMIQKPTQDVGFLYDPYTGLVWPLRAERYELTAREGLPIFQTELSQDWLTLEFAPEIQVPPDAWYDYDPVNNKWITVGEVFPDGLTTNTKNVVYYPADLYETVKWHDGSPISVGDFVMQMIMTYAQCKPESPIYDESAVDTCDSWFTHFKGVRITSVDPLVIESYDDLYALDAELNAVPQNSWWPNETNVYPYGGGPWSTMALGLIGETTGEMAFTAAKATAAEIERTGFLSGTTLQALAGYLDACVADPASCLPFGDTFAQFVTVDEADARFTNLKAFYVLHNHIWIGTGPYFIDAVYPVERTVTLKQYADYPDLADRWSRFGSPKLVTVEVDGPAQVAIGSEAVFSVYVTNNDEPYPSADLSGVKWLLFDKGGSLVATGDATLISDGEYSVTLTSDVTSKLTAGGNKLEIAVSSKLVSVPGLGAYEFVTFAP
jgi:peptide/nickel transport system substrate-binding protein